MAARATAIMRGALRSNVPLKGLNSWRVGGPADRLFRPADLDDLALFLSQTAADEPLTWLGLGTNVLVRDGGVRGTVIATHAALDDVVRLDNSRVRAQAGVPCAKLARRSADWSLAGAEFMAGIPGTLGGALAMNAGAFGGQTRDVVAAVDTIDRRGVIRRRLASEFSVDYRHVEPPCEEWFVAAELALKAGNMNVSRREIQALLARRGVTQPLGVASCGSVFRNPPGDFAARLIDTAGLKGHRIGGACVSSMHANFIINDAEASAADIEALIGFVQRRVEDAHGVRLVPEVRIVGRAGARNDT
ncbi:MAG: UDP-N-acetylmuramate dehydrogenase [Gammaproteobacteria bacterium]